MRFASILIAAALAFSLASAGMAAETEISHPSQLTIGFLGNGISIQEDASLPITAYFGQDTLYGSGLTINVVRANRYSIASAVTKNGKLVWRETGTASADGKQFVCVREQPGEKGFNETTLVYERAGTAPMGDPFLGTWRRIAVKTRHSSTAHSSNGNGDSAALFDTIRYVRGEK